MRLPPKRLLPLAPAAGPAELGAAENPVADGVRIDAHDFLEHLVDTALRLLGIPDSGNTVTHFAVAAGLLVIALLGRRIVTGLFSRPCAVWRNAPRPRWTTSCSRRWSDRRRRW